MRTVERVTRGVLGWLVGLCGFGLVLLLSSCSGNGEGGERSADRPGPPVETTTTPPTTTDVSPPASEQPAARGDVIVNLRPFNTDFDALTPWIDGIGYVRVWGGTRGMATYPTLDAVPDHLLDHPRSYNVVTQDEIDALLDLQDRHGVRVIYMVNVNDTLESQREFIARLVVEGIDLAILEMGNELYLRKFRDGDITQLGVTRSWSPEDYAAMLEEWVPELGGFDVPIYIVGASHGSGDSGRDLNRQYWNEVMVEAIDDRVAIDGVTFHRYAGEERSGESHEEAISNESFAFLSTFGDLPIAITESGYAFSEMTPENLDLAEEFWTEFDSALKPGDLFGVHVMYRPSEHRTISYGLFDEDGRTPVGDRFAEWLTGR